MTNEETVEAAAHRVAALLTKKGLTLAVAEATNCGLLGCLLTTVPGSSRYFLGGIAPYSQVAKVKALGVAQGVLEEKGSVSRETALEMARRVRELFDADVGLAETGMAGPGGDAASKPVGLFYVALSSSEGRDVCQEERFSGGREEIRRRSAQSALEMLEKFVRQP